MTQRLSNHSSLLIFILAASSLTTASDPYKIVIDNVGNFEAQKLDKKLYVDPLRPLLYNKLGSSSLDIDVRAPDVILQTQPEKTVTSDSRVVTSSVRKVTTQIGISEVFGNSTRNVTKVIPDKPFIARSLDEESTTSTSTTKSPRTTTLKMESSSLKQEDVKVDSIQSTLLTPKETSAQVVQVKKIPSEEGQTPVYKVKKKRKIESQIVVVTKHKDVRPDVDEITAPDEPEVQKKTPGKIVKTSTTTTASTTSTTTSATKHPVIFERATTLASKIQDDKPASTTKGPRSASSTTRRTTTSIRPLVILTRGTPRQKQELKVLNTENTESQFDTEKFLPTIKTTQRPSITTTKMSEFPTLLDEEEKLPETLPDPAPLVSNQDIFGLYDVPESQFQRYNDKKLSSDFTTTDFELMQPMDYIDYDSQTYVEPNQDVQPSEDGVEDGIRDTEEGYVHWVDVPKETEEVWVDSGLSTTPSSEAVPRQLNMFDHTFRGRKLVRTRGKRRDQRNKLITARPTVAKEEPLFDHDQILINPKTIRSDVRPSKVRLFYEKVEDDIVDKKEDLPLIRNKLRRPEIKTLKTKTRKPQKVANPVGDVLINFDEDVTEVTFDQPSSTTPIPVYFPPAPIQNTRAKPETESPWVPTIIPDGKRHFFGIEDAYFPNQDFPSQGQIHSDKFSFQVSGPSSDGFPSIMTNFETEFGAKFPTKTDQKGDDFVKAKESAVKTVTKPDEFLQPFYLEKVLPSPGKVDFPHFPQKVPQTSLDSFKPEFNLPTPFLSFESNAGNKQHPKKEYKLLKSEKDDDELFKEAEKGKLDLLLVPDPYSKNLRPQDYEKEITFGDQIGTAKKYEEAKKLDTKFPSQTKLVDFNTFSQNSGPSFNNDQPRFKKDHQSKDTHAIPGPPYFIDPPSDAVMTFIPPEVPSFHPERDQYSRDLELPTHIPESTTPVASLTDLYSKDVYSEGNFAQLEPFFSHSEDKALKIPTTNSKSFPRILRHITTYGRSLNFPHQTRNDLVDFGAASGDSGSFGWYTDHPVLY